MEKKILVTKSMLPPMEEYIQEIKRIWDTCWMTNMGPIYDELVRDLKQYLGCNYIELYVNGHMALDVAIKALNLTGEVITTPFTFASTTHALVMNGLTPVFCDIKPDDYTIDENKIESLITRNTCAIVPVHVYGMPCNFHRIQEIADRHGLKVIYDAAHTFGVTVDGTSLADVGDVSMYSFHATKVFNTIEGGALTFRDKTYEAPFRSLRNFGIASEESVEAVGLNAKMNEFCAAMGVCNLRHIAEAIKARKKAAERYDARLHGIPGLTIPDLFAIKKKKIEWNYSYYPILIDEKLTGINRDEVYDQLKKGDIYTRKYFYPLIVDYDCYKGRFSADLPVARYTADHVLTLPMYADLDEETVDRICDNLLGMLK